MRPRFFESEINDVPADLSLLRFERMEEDMGLDPITFAYRLMTRSGRIDREKLRKRDPGFVAAYESVAR